MKRFEYTQDYEGKKKGDIVEIDMKMYHGLHHPLLMRGILRVVGSKKEESESDSIVSEPKETVRDILLKLKMKVLRDFGKSYDARDTNKEELVDEIIEKAPKEDIIKYLEAI